MMDKKEIVISGTIHYKYSFGMKWIIMILFVVLIGCNFNGTWNDDHIDPAIRKSVDNLNDQVASALKGNRPEVILSLSSDGLIAKAKNDISALTNEVSRNIPADAIFNKLKQFYIKGSSENIPITLLSDKKDGHDYKITFTTLNKNTVATVGEFTHAYQTYFLLTVYGKYGDSWKLNILKIGAARISGKDAIDWYNQTKADLRSGDTIDAVNKFTIARNLMKPGGEYWFYQKEDEMNRMGEALQPIVNSQPFFPVKLSINNRTVSVVGTTPKVGQVGYNPMFLYITSIPLADSIFLSRECDSIHIMMGQLHPALLQNNDTILYSAFRKMPSSVDDSCYTFIRRVVHRQTINSSP